MSTRATILFCIAAAAVVAALKDCDNVLSDVGSRFVGQCNNKWSNLKPLVMPTQSGVGFAWIKYKLDKSFTSASNAQDEIDSSPTPAVIGPDNRFYIVDDHHTLCALDYSGYTSTSVTLEVICDKRSTGLTMEEFFSDLQSQGLCFLGAHPGNDPNALPVLIPYTSLPQSFDFTPTHTSFANDPWRALAGYSRKVTTVPGFPSCGKNDDKNCERCFYRGCGSGGQASSGQGVAFFEFQWAYYMNDAAIKTASLWPTKEAYEVFVSAYKLLPVSSAVATVKSIEPDDWLAAATLLIPLCRSASVGLYSVPTSIYSGSGVLPGYALGPVKLQADPSCSAPSCK